MAARAAASTRIEDYLFHWLSTRPPATLAVCWPVRGEFDPRPLAGRLAAQGWTLSMPVVVVPAAPMAFHRWTPGDPLVPGVHGIPVPASAQPARPDVVLVPLVAFDDRCYRLGYGGGYFDRTLAALTPRPETVGVGFELGRVDSILPEAHDLPLDRIVTEAGVFVRPEDRRES